MLAYDLLAKRVNDNCGAVNDNVYFRGGAVKKLSPGMAHPVRIMKENWCLVTPFK
jgi:hypothetical protein